MSGALMGARLGHRRGLPLTAVFVEYLDLKATGDDAAGYRTQAVGVRQMVGLHYRGAGRAWASMTLLVTLSR